jgi:hypothetical protein
MNEELLKLLKITYGDDEDDSVLSAFLCLAESRVRNRLYPYGNGNEVVPRKYRMKIVEIATYLLNKRGAEGETQHKEGDITRIYENGDIPDSMMEDIIPFVGVCE